MIYLGADHRGFALKEKIKEWLDEWDKDYEDLGNDKYDSMDDFPDFAIKVGEKVSKNKGEGILLCGSGGMALAANKIKGVRAVEVWDIERARHAKSNDNANVLTIPADVVDTRMAKEMLKVWLETKVKKEKKYKRRLNKIKKLEKENFK